MKLSCLFIDTQGIHIVFFLHSFCDITELFLKVVLNTIIASEEYWVINTLFQNWKQLFYD